MQHRERLQVQCLCCMQVNQRYEFTETLEFKEELMAPDADLSVKQVYKLFSVLVHSGASGGGHYYAYIRASDGKWYKFDDEQVTQVEQAEAIEQQFGDEAPVQPGVLCLGPVRPGCSV